MWANDKAQQTRSAAVRRIILRSYVCSEGPRSCLLMEKWNQRRKWRHLSVLGKKKDCA